MVAQSCETVYQAVTPWGRTSPATASTPDEHQPMDLVTRNRGQTDHQRPGDYGWPSQDDEAAFHQQQHMVTRGENVCSQVERQVHPRPIQQALQERPSQGQADGATLHGKDGELQPADAENVDPSENQESLQTAQDPLPSKLNHVELVQFSQKQNLPFVVEEQSGLQLGSEAKLQSKQPTRKKQMKQEMLYRWELENGRQPRDGQIKITWEREPIVGQPRDSLVGHEMQPSDKIIIQHVTPHMNNQYREKQTDKSQNHVQSQECKQYDYIGQNAVRAPVCDLRLKTENVPEASTEIIPFSHQLDTQIQEQESASEGATSLLLLSDGKWQSPSPLAVEVHPVMQILGREDQQKPLDSYTTRSDKLPKDTLLRIESNNQTLKAAEQQDAEHGCSDDDKDGTLFIVDSDAQIAGVENGRQDDRAPDLDGPSNGEEQCDDFEDVNHITQEDETMDKEEEHKLGNASKSRSRVESQKKMEEGKFWLLNNIMILGGTLPIIKLSDIEKSYWTYCQENDKEPLATPVLARLIHNLFPSADKCRLGARGNQRIHYRNLAFKSARDDNKQQSPELGKDKQRKTQVNHQVTQVNNQVTQVNNQVTQVNNQMSQPPTDSCVEPDAKPDCQTIQHGSKEKEFTNQQTKLNGSKIFKDAFNESELLDGKKQATLLSRTFSISSQDDEEGCKSAAKKLSEVLKWITGQGEGHRRALLRDFAHSASCQKPTCEPVCLMFRRVRRHVVAAQHSCSVLRLYSMLLRHHVSSCTQAKCGLPACPALRATRPCKRPSEQQSHPAKRAAITQGQGMYYPSSMVLSSRSPEGSLPGSPVNSPPPSPTSTPERILTLPTGHVKVIMLPVMMPFVENHVISE